MDESIKKQVRGFLEQRDYKRLVDLCEKDRHFWKELKFYLYDVDEAVRWPAIEAAAKLMQRWWELGKKQKVREYIRNLFWLMNDESGGIGWSSPQTIAEIIVYIPELIDPYGNMMIAHSLEEPPLVKGGLWGIGRLGKRLAEGIDFFQGKVLAAFQSKDIETLGLAAWAMGEVNFKPALPFIKALRGHRETVRIYKEGIFHEKTLGEWAEEALGKIVTYQWN
jgi:hypothetical protein